MVIGGGWAGSAAAMAGLRRGWRTLLLEAGPSLGGRARSRPDPMFGELDNGQHLFLGAYHRSLALLGDLGTAGAIRFQSPLRIPYLMADGRVETLLGSAWPGPLSLGLGLLRHAPLSGAAKRQLLTLGLPWKGGPRLALALLGRDSPGSQGLSVGQWLRSCGQGPELMDQVWEPMTLAALNARPDEARLSEFLAVLGQGFLRGGPTAALGLSTLPLARLLAPLGPWLAARGGELRLGAVLRSLAWAQGTWHLSLAGTPLALRGARVILALPAARALALLGPERSAALGLPAEAARPRSPITSVYTLSEQPLLPEALVAFGPQSAGRQALFHWGFSGSQGGAWRSAFVASASEGLAASTPARVLAQLAGFLAGRGRPHQWNAARVIVEKGATPRFAPGSGRRLAQATALPGLALAGDWTATGLPATLEGAVRSGEAAVVALA